MGIVYILLAAVLFGANPTVESVLLASGVTSEYIAFVVVAVSCVLALIAGIVKKESFKLTRKQLFYMILAGVIGRGVTEICLVRAYTMVPAGVATMIHFFFPTVVCIASIVIFHEKWTRARLAAVILSVCGLIGIADGQSGGSIYGVLTAGITSFSFAFYYLMTERSCIRDISPMVMIFYLHLFGAAVCFIPLAAGGGIRADLNAEQHIVLFLSGLICFAGYIFLNRGIPMAGAATAAFINMLEPVTSLVLSVAVLGSRLSFPAAAGCILIVGAMFVSAAGGRNSVPECVK